MTKRTALVVAILAMSVGVVIGAWTTQGVLAQPKQPRYEVERYDGFMVIRNPRTGDCLLAVNGGGITGVSCF